MARLEIKIRVSHMRGKGTNPEMYLEPFLWFFNGRGCLHFTIIVTRKHSVLMFLNLIFKVKSLTITVFCICMFQ